MESSFERFLCALIEKAGGCRKALKEILYGMMLHEMHLELKRERNVLDQFFMLIVFGDLVGLPLLPPYYAMRVLPYVLPSVKSWKRSILREKDLTDLAAMDI
jgi:hypothetical protein